MDTDMNTEQTFTAADLERLTTPDQSRNPRAKPYREALRAALEGYKTEYELSVREVARELGVGATAVSKYLNKVPEGDVEKLEERIADAVKAAPKRREYSEGLFESSVTKAVAGVCELIRKTNDFGLIHGRAGIGKTEGVKMYAAANPTAILLTMTRWTAFSDGVTSALFEQLDGRSKDHNESRVAWMVKRLRDSKRLIIVDNAQRLSKCGLEWLFDFNDETRCPIALVGNPGVLKKISSCDQKFSRVGYARPIELKRPAEAARAMLENFCPEFAEQLLPLAQKVASKRGYLRSLRKHLLLLPEFEKAAKGCPVTAFRMAHTQLVCNYDLNEED